MAYTGDYRNGRHVVHAMHVHLAFVTKYQPGAFDDEMLSFREETMQKICAELGVQFARTGVRVNALCPGPVNTPLLQEVLAKDPERAARRLVHVPAGRFAEAAEIAEIAAAVAFLASDDASFIAASQFMVDGGIAGAHVTPT